MDTNINHSLTDFESDSDDDHPSSKADPRTETRCDSSNSRPEQEPTHYSAGDIVPQEDLPNWCSWEPEVSELDGFTVVQPLTTDTHLVYPTENHSISFNKVAYLPNESEAHEARNASHFDSLKTLRDLPTTYSELSGDSSPAFDPDESFPPLVTAQSISYGGVCTVDGQALENAYRITQGTGHISPTATRITPLSGRYSILEDTTEGHSYLLSNTVKEPSHPAVANQDYSPTTRAAGSVTIPDDSERVARLTEKFIDHVDAICDISIKKHLRAGASSHAFAADSGKEYTIKEKSLRSLNRCTPLSDTESLIGEHEIYLDPGTATISVSSDDIKHDYGSYVYDKLQKQRALGAAISVMNSGYSPYNTSRNRKAVIQYYTISIKRHDKIPDTISLSKGPSSDIQQINISDISYGS